MPLGETHSGFVTYQIAVIVIRLSKPQSAKQKNLPRC